jgi:ParB family chromosome partitioning protein
MTDTTPTSTVEAEDSTPAALLGTLEHLNPADLVLDTNVRDDAAVDADFLASVKEHGVLTPIAALRDDDGTVRVRAGQRRTVAARQAGLKTVPVYVRPASGADEKPKWPNASPSRSSKTISAKRSRTRSGHAAFSR